MLYFITDLESRKIVRQQKFLLLLLRVTQENWGMTGPVPTSSWCTPDDESVMLSSSTTAYYFECIAHYVKRSIFVPKFSKKDNFDRKIQINKKINKIQIDYFYFLHHLKSWTKIDYLRHCVVWKIPKKSHLTKLQRAKLCLFPFLGENSDN